MNPTFVQGPCSSSSPACIACPSRRPRDRRVPCAAATEGTQPATGTRPIVVKSVSPARPAAPPPKPVPIEHSSAYLLHARQREEVGTSALPDQRRDDDSVFAGGAMEWALRKADASLDEIEDNPPAYARALYDISTGPVGTAASKGVATVARVTVQVGSEAIKAAAPVGKWALQQSFNMAVSIVAKGIGGRRRQKGGDK